MLIDDLGRWFSFDEFQFLLRSAASPIAAPILSASLHASFVKPLAKKIGGAHAQGCAARR